MSERFYVATTTGWPNVSAGGITPPGVSAMVLDRAWGHREVVLYRSEDEHVGTAAARRAAPVVRAERRAAELNAGPTPSEP